MYHRVWRRSIYSESIEQWTRFGRGSAALVGGNGAGKSSVLARVARSLDGELPIQASDRSTASREATNKAAEMVSFEATVDFLKLYGDRSVAWVCGGVHAKKTRSLIVRFGLMNCWYKKVEVLSSGEFRKLMLARAMASEPELLLLDGAHDGLDPSSRKQLGRFLTSLVKGLPPLLVELGGYGSSQKRISVRVLQAAQRQDEFAANLQSAFLMRQSGEVIETSFSQDVMQTLISEPSGILVNDLDDRALQFLFERQPRQGEVAKLTDSRVRFCRVERFGEEEKEQDLGGLKGVSLTVQDGQVWALCGPNGAGKTLVSRILSTPGAIDQDQSLAEVALGERHETAPQEEYKFGENNEMLSVQLFGSLKGSKGTFENVIASVGVVSINAHMRLLHFAERIHEERGAQLTVRDVIASGLYGGACSGSSGPQLFRESLNDILTGAYDHSRVEAALRVIGLETGLLDRAFVSLSLGEQRLVLVARCIVNGPRLCVFDEACQSLDVHSRRRMSKLIDAMAKLPHAPAILLITHHADEVPESITHMALLQDGSVKSACSAQAEDVKMAIHREYE